MRKDKDAVLSLPPKLVDLAAIEKELSLLQEKKEDGRPSGEAPIFRACSLNLVTVVSDARRAAAVSRAMGSVSQLHPTRAIVIHHQPRAAASDLSSKVSGHCRFTASGQRQVCCEQIDLIAKGHLTEHLHSALASLLSPDLPVYLWWFGSLPPRDDLLERLSDQAGILVTKADESPDPAAALSWLASFVEKRGGRPAPAEMAWFQLDDWRRFVTRFFDRPPADLPWEEMDTIVIRCAATEPPATALLLGGWLSSRLGWTPRRGSPKSSAAAWAMEKDGRAMSLRFVAAPVQEGGHEKIVSVAVSAGAGKPRSIVITREQRRYCLLGRGGAGRASLEQALAAPPRLPLDEILCRVLGSGGEDPAFLPSLKQVAAFVPRP